MHRTLCSREQGCSTSKVQITAAEPARPGAEGQLGVVSPTSGTQCGVQAVWVLTWTAVHARARVQDWFAQADAQYRYLKISWALRVHSRSVQRLTPHVAPPETGAVQAMVQSWFTQINAQHRDPRSREQEQERTEREAHNRAVRLQVGLQELLSHLLAKTSSFSATP